MLFTVYVHHELHCESRLCLLHIYGTKKLCMYNPIRYMKYIKYTLIVTL